MMKYIKLFLLLLIGFGAQAQLPTNTFRSRIFNGNTEAQWLILDSPLVNFVSTSLFNARYAGTQFVKIGGGDTAFYFGAGGNLWFRSLLSRDTVSLSNRINLKLNITDTTGKWWGIGKRWADTLYRVNDSTVGYTINGSAYTFQILGRVGGGGSGTGTVTSVGLSMPSAFTVGGTNPVTSSGTIAVTGAGTTAQYIRGNGTLATTDTGMIPNFYLKVRGLLSGTSPITFNTTTGAIGITNANVSGTKGAATFSSTSFADNGSGLISLATLLSAGSCTNCSLTFDIYGRATAYSAGTTAVTALGPIGSTPNANGATITSNVLNLEPASGSFGGVVTTGTQTFGGTKTFTSAPMFTSFTTGSVPYIGTSGLLSQNNANLFWDNANTALAIATNTISSGFKLTVNGNGAFTNVKLGAITSFTQAAFTGGTIASVPFLGLYNSGGLADGKIWDFQIDGNIFSFNVWDDAIVSNNSVFSVTRSGLMVQQIQFPNGNIGLGPGTPAVSLHINTVDAIRIPTGATSGRPTGAVGYLRVNTDSLNRPEYFDGTNWKTLASSAGVGNTLYSGNGTLAADRNVASGGFTLRFTGANNSDTLVSMINTGTTSTGLYTFGTSIGIKTVSDGIGISGFGTSQGATLEGATAEGALIKSDAIRAILAQTVPSSTNTVIEVMRLERGSTGGPGGSGIGEYVSFYNKTSDNSSQESNEIISKFTDATVGTRTSQFSITGLNNASTNTILTIAGDGTFTTIGKRIVGVTTSSAGTLTIGNSEAYIFNGTTTTWTLPAVSGTTGYKYYLKNIGSGTITLNANGGASEIYSTSAVTTYPITTGSAIILISNGTYFTVN